VSFKIMTSVTTPCFTTPDLQDQDRFFLVWDWSCPKTNGLRPYHWITLQSHSFASCSSVRRAKWRVLKPIVHHSLLQLSTKF